MRAPASVRVRTTIAATLVVGLSLTVAAIGLVLAVRATLYDAAQTSAEQRAEELADDIDAAGTVDGAVSRVERPDADDVDDEAEDGDDPDDADPDEVVWQVIDAGGQVLAASQQLGVALPREDGRIELPGGDAPYILGVADADIATDAGEDAEVSVVVATSLEDVHETTTALIAPLALGVPLLLLVVAGTTWAVVGRALRPVDRIRREVDEITGARLDRRVSEPSSRDELHRLAVTMNRMLGRLQDSQQRQQQFVSDASHELRSPLASLRQAAEVTRAHPAALPEGELAEVVLEEAVRMQGLVGQLLLLARAGEGALHQREEVDLDDVVLAATRRYRGAAGPDVDTSAVSAARVHGDAAALTQVVTNLTDNAVRHALNKVVVGLTQHSGRARLTVEDDGAGVPAAERERIFDRFVRLDEARARDGGGSGLGLSIVRAVVEAHQGTVHVEGSAAGGARFVVDLPAAR